MNRLGWLLLASVGLSWLVASMVLRWAEHWQLVQSPTYRSSHVLPTANGGGLGVVAAALVAGAWLAWSGANQLWPVLALSLPLAWVGFLDDVRHLSAKWRFAVQLAVVAGLLAALGGLPPLVLWAGLGLDGWLLLGLLFLVGAWWINLFNFMDGIDGIAGMQAVFMLLGGAGLAAWANPAAFTSPVWMLMLCVSAATMGFLLLNWPPAKIFMGDVGSTWLGFMIFALALLSIQAGWLSYAAWLVLAAVFVTDATVTLLTRMAHGERWYEAHRSHAYQRLSRRWHGDRKVGHRSVTLLVTTINLLWLAPWAWACLLWPQWALGWVLLAYAPLVVGVAASGAGRPDVA
ncbi:glycosyltransferase WbpL [Polynucleobacter sp. TUM22923]|uniref:glycosyl transferase n=1 Tax=Polynucleobacter sp. TUM22923 TaxID=3022126 RepID=UPI002573216F|nr:glycosyl transferase [Polynucleobacter sp. TUM22923]BDX22485.1 glycosyltransferase WbpL [Polynucleobacter sp. TUM22923]